MNHKFEDDFDNFGKAVERGLAMFKGYEARINSLRSTFKENQKSTIGHVENSLKLSDTRIHDLEDSLRLSKQRVANLNGELSTQKLNNDLTNIHLKKTKSELEDATRRVEVLETELETAKQDLDDLENDFGRVAGSKMELEDRLSAAEQRETELRAELELGRRQNAELQERLNTVEPQCLDLQADLKTARQQASTAEDELKSFKAHYDQVHDMMTAYSSPSKQSTKPASSSDLPLASQGSMEGRHGESQAQNHHLQASGLDSHASNTMADQDFDLVRCQNVLNELMANKNWQYNRYFLGPLDLAPTTHSLNREVTQPNNLNLMKEKLATGAYTSNNSFKADFGIMIVDYKMLVPPDDDIAIAADQLWWIFKQACSAQHISSHRSPDDASSARGTNNQKRKAEIECPTSSENGQVQKRRLLAPLDQDNNHVRPGSPGSREMLSSVPSSSELSEGSSCASDLTAISHAKGKLTTGQRLGISATLSVVAQFVSATKSPTTITGHWKSLIPDEYRLTGPALPSTVEDRLLDLVCKSSMDMIILRLMPADEDSSVKFNSVFDCLLNKERFATISHAGIGDVEDIFLITSSSSSDYPKFLSTLDFDLLPATKTENVLFMVVVFCVKWKKQEQVRKAWDGRLKAVERRENDSLNSIRHTFMRNPLHIFHGCLTMVSSAKRHLSELETLPYSEEIASPELQAYGQNLLRLSYASWIHTSRPSVDGVRAPEWVFVLGTVVCREEVYGVLITDMQKADRPLWLIIPCTESQFDSDLTITLLRSKFPGSLKEWKAIPSRLIKYPNRYCLKNIGLKWERCKVLG